MKMKAKLLNAFTVCLVTLAILSPEIAVLGIVWHQHLHLEKTNLFVNNTNFHIKDVQILEKNSFLKPKQQNEFLFIFNKYKIIFILESLLICIPVSIGVSIFAYEKYLIYRAEVYRKQVEILEKMWQKSNYW
ncbi:hypothetical protein DSM106972_024230 [Dulcicalothrix desertica PCC 7102]|uniref:Uncharacterized protein n=2 Tax=Dulcicalothrix desertica TaxID=32056 RepID=A0A433VM93_9CYAN|nr:hypothetical protein DSM106972_024230 [Dulcicalothrix desertica PCC 7102]